MRDVVIDGNHLNIEDAVALSKGLARATISDKSMKAMSASRQAIEKIIQSDEVVYGINTGFGSKASVRISGSDLDDLQTNLIRSHACGIG